MLGRLSAAVLTKAKVAALVALSLSAGGVGGAVALSHVAPNSHLVRESASTTPTDSATPDPSASYTPTAVATPTVTPDPTEDPDAEPTPTPDGQVSPSDAPSGYALPDCPADGSNHVDYTSSVGRSAPKGKDGAHGDWTRQAARSDCGKPAVAASPRPSHPAGHTRADRATAPARHGDSHRAGKPTGPGGH